MNDASGWGQKGYRPRFRSRGQGKGTGMAANSAKTRAMASMGLGVKSATDPPFLLAHGAVTLRLRYWGWIAHDPG